MYLSLLIVIIHQRKKKTIKRKKKKHFRGKVIKSALYRESSSMSDECVSILFVESSFKEINMRRYSHVNLHRAIVQ